MTLKVRSVYHAVFFWPNLQFRPFWIISRHFRVLSSDTMGIPSRLRYGTGRDGTGRDGTDFKKSRVPCVVGILANFDHIITESSKITKKYHIKTVLKIMLHVHLS